MSQTISQFRAVNQHSQIIGRRVQVPVHYDAWTRGARFGRITAFREGKPGQSASYLVQLDAMPNAKRLRIWSIDWNYAELVD